MSKRPAPECMTSQIIDNSVRMAVTFQMKEFTDKAALYKRPVRQMRSKFCYQEHDTADCSTIPQDEKIATAIQERLCLTCLTPTLADAIRIASTKEAILAMEKDEENHQLVNAVALLTESVRKLNTREDNDSQFRRYEDRKSHSRDQSKDRDRDQKPNRWKKNSYQSNHDQGNQERRRPHYQRRNYRQSNGDEEHSEHRQRNQSRDNYGRGRSQGRNRGNHFTNFLFATVVIAAALIQPSTAIDYFDCTKTTGGILIRPPTPTNCTTDSPTSEIERRVATPRAHDGRQRNYIVISQPANVPHRMPRKGERALQEHMMVANATMLSSTTQLTSHVKCARKGKRALREHRLVANATMLSLMSQPISHVKERLKEHFLPDGAEYQPA
ncbi:hypothetical protein L5515_000101 [Caenorhabditis briggsae]|uniref:Uncharacterized protein n=1 Tax=Caenorhabditis briggsae TaxID=6238 RepID=A0AAE9DYR7_CAEBR|nr:hypothetical protein L5515_000101 [Caenorhabditis briggsae]